MYRLILVFILFFAGYQWANSSSANKAEIETSYNDNYIAPVLKSDNQQNNSTTTEVDIPQKNHDVDYYINSETDGSSNEHYSNCDGQTVHNPANYEGVPAGASAICRDGTFSFSRHRRGTCSRHGGVAEWLY
jgi:Protein of unknown function (DUF3761)